MVEHGRLKGSPAYPHGFEPTFHEERLVQPYGARKPAFIFTVSMGDLFGASVPDEWIEKVLQVIRENPQHIFALLTKNAGRLRKVDRAIGFPPNAWCGVTVNTLDDVYKLEILRDLSPEVRFVSLEPMQDRFYMNHLLGLSWVIAGAQTGPMAPPVNRDEFKRLATMLGKWDVPTFLKANTGLEGPREWPGTPRQMEAF